MADEYTNIVKAVRQELSIGKPDATLTVGNRELLVRHFEDIPTDVTGSYVLYDALFAAPDNYYGGEYSVSGQLIFIIVNKTSDKIPITKISDALHDKLSRKRLQHKANLPIYITDVGSVEAVTTDQRYPDEIRKRYLLNFTYFV